MYLHCIVYVNCIGRTHFEWFYKRLILKKRKMATQKWPISPQWKTLLTFTVQNFSQGSEEEQSCISSTNGCDCLWHKVIVCLLFAVNQTLWCLTRVWSIGTVTHWVSLFFTFCCSCFWPFGLTLVFPCGIELPFWSVWFVCKVTNLRTTVNIWNRNLYGTITKIEKNCSTILWVLKKLFMNRFSAAKMVGYFSFLAD